MLQADRRIDSVVLKVYSTVYLAQPSIGLWIKGYSFMRNVGILTFCQGTYELTSSDENTKNLKEFNMKHKKTVYTASPEPSARAFRATLPLCESHLAEG
jgi:hypothetical protein